MSSSADGGRVTGGLRPVRSLVRLGALVVVLSTVLPLHGLAASMSTTTRTLGDGEAEVSRCDTDGMKVILNYGTLVGETTSFATATISQISSACAGATLAASVNNGVTSSSGSTSVPAGGGTVTVSFATAVAATDTVQSDLAVAGP